MTLMLRHDIPRFGARRRMLARLLLGGAASWLWPYAAFAQQPVKPMRIGLTPAFLNDQHSLLERWRRYLEHKLAREIVFVKRDSYRETIDMLQQERLEFAWICDYPFIHLKQRVRLLAVPLFQQKPSYRAYLIVPSSDQRTTSITQLGNTVFAYADPYSNTGHLAPRYALLRAGKDPATFFRKTFFTSSHRKVVEAVAARLVQGGSVDSFVWESLSKLEPELTARTRIVERSVEFGFPPFVANRQVSDADFAAFQQVLLAMPGDREGAQLLKRLNLDGFVVGRTDWYDGVAQMMQAFDEH